MHIHRANLTNLTGLWKKYGAQKINNDTRPLIFSNTHWPNRYWFEWDNISEEDLQQTLQSSSKIKNLFDHISDSTIVPVWPMINPSEKFELTNLYDQLIEYLLIQKNWICSFEQTAMYLELNKETIKPPLINTDFKVQEVNTSEDIMEWVSIGSEAFTYTIDTFVIEQLINNKNIQILLGIQNGQAVACGLLYKSDDVTGVHQLGVKQDFQGKGIARRFMQEIISICTLWKSKYIVLQASPAGKPLYVSLGFRTQFSIKNFQRL